MIVAVGRENPLPRPVSFGAWVFPGECGRKTDTATAFGPRGVVMPFPAAEVLSKRADETLGHDAHPILCALRLPNQQLACVQVDILDPLPQGLSGSHDRLQPARGVRERNGAASGVPGQVIAAVSHSIFLPTR